jgi:hypothetical protein
MQYKFYASSLMKFSLYSTVTSVLVDSIRSNCLASNWYILASRTSLIVGICERSKSHVNILSVLKTRLLSKFRFFWIDLHAGLDVMQVECVVIYSALHLGAFGHGLSVFADNWGLLWEPFGYSEVWHVPYVKFWIHSNIYGYLSHALFTPGRVLLWILQRELYLFIHFV